MLAIRLEKGQGLNLLLPQTYSAGAPTVVQSLEGTAMLQSCPSTSEEPANHLLMLETTSPTVGRGAYIVVYRLSPIHHADPGATAQQRGTGLSSPSCSSLSMPAHKK